MTLKFTKLNSQSINKDVVKHLRPIRLPSSSAGEFVSGLKHTFKVLAVFRWAWLLLSAGPSPVHTTHAHRPLDSQRCVECLSSPSITVSLLNIFLVFCATCPYRNCNLRSVEPQAFPVFCWVRFVQPPLHVKSTLYHSESAGFHGQPALRAELLYHLNWCGSRWLAQARML